MEADLKKGEGLSLPLTLLVMVLIFGGFAAAGVPLAGAIASIAGGLISLLAFTYVIDLDITVVNVVTVLGLGLCIDYSLLMVSRYREQMHDLHDLSVPGAHREVPPEVRERAMAITMATAGRTVMFSGVTVAIAVAGLLFIDMTIIQSVGAGAVSVVVIAVVVATTFVPALLVLSTKHVAGAGMLSRAPGFRRFAGAFDHSPSDDGWFARWATQGPAARVAGVPQRDRAADPAVDPRVADEPRELRGRAAAAGQPDTARCTSRSRRTSPRCPRPRSRWWPTPRTPTP